MMLGKRSLRARMLDAALVALLALLLPMQVHAHGGGTPILTKVEAGPYWIYVFSQQPTPAAGAEYHISVAVTQTASDGSEAAVGGAEVTVVLTPAGGGAPITAVAEPALASGAAYYEADVRLPEAGAWQAVVNVNSPLGAGGTAYTVEVLAGASGPPWGWIIAGAVVSVLAVVAVLVVGLRRTPAADEENDAEVAPVLPMAHNRLEQEKSK